MCPISGWGLITKTSTPPFFVGGDYENIIIKPSSPPFLVGGDYENVISPHLHTLMSLWEKPTVNLTPTPSQGVGG